MGFRFNLNRKILVVTLTFGLVNLVSVGILGYHRVNYNRVYNANLDMSENNLHTLNLCRSIQLDFKVQVQDWKDILIRGYSKESFENYLSQFLLQESLVRSNTRVLSNQLVEEPDLIALLNQFADAHREMGEKYRTALKLFNKADRNSYLVADALVKGVDRLPGDLLTQLANRIEDNASAGLAHNKSEFRANASGFLMLFLGIILLIAILSLVFMNIIHLTISKPISNMSKVLGSIAEGGGDLTRQIAVKSDDEVGDLAGNFNLFLNNLNDDIVQVAKAARQLSSLSTESEGLVSKEVKSDLSKIESVVRHIEDKTASATSGIEQLTSTVEEIVRNIDSISGNIVRQSSAVEESASSIEEMVRNIENTAVMTNQTRDISHKLITVAREGGDAVGKALGSIREVSEYSQQILKMLSLIATVAKQTNLLAMNAAIEAAHAGEAGKGFAIVADEIRRLAEDTNRNAREIGDVVGTIVSRIGDSVNLSEKAGEGLHAIVDYAGENNQVVERLSVTMEEQSSGAKEILHAIQELVSITEEVRTSIAEQKVATGEFSSAIKEIRDLTVENRTEIQTHFESLGKLIQRIDHVRETLQKNLALANLLKTLMDKFVTREREPEKTGLKLVE
jgi:methyl-accepting chemotaxis protein